MFRAIKDRILQIRKAVGLEICLLPDDRILINRVYAKIVKGRLVKGAERHYLQGFEELAAHTDKSMPVSVVLSGRGVLYKKAPDPASGTNSLEYLLPAANPDEFYLETIYPGKEEPAFVAIIRKELLTRILDSLQQAGFRVLSCSLGGIRDTGRLLSLLPVREPVVDTAVYSFYPGEGGILEGVTSHAVDTERDDPEYNFGDQYVRASSVVAFAAATALLIDPIDGHAGREPARIESQRTDFKDLLLCRAALWATLLGAFAILLLNFAIYNIYFNRNKDLQESHTSVQMDSERIAALEAQVQLKEAFAAASGWGRASRLSYYADRIAGSLPSTILLTGMKICPLRVNDMTDNGMCSFRQDTIELTGTCGDPTEMAGLTGNLRNTGITKAVTIRNYIYKKETGIGSFSIQLITP